ncbi:MAG TPA: LysM peptidoglycan-binding domain-containing protein [Bacteroidia bacterium]|nr:LysM peptidoglycan-binding domain-containing protein [Bacteroidia bacterium]
MGQLPGRAVAKLTILPCKEVAGKLIPSGIPFIAPYNPNTFSFAQESVNVLKPTNGSSTPVYETKYTENKILTVDFFLDGTGASPPLGLSLGSAAGAAVSSLASSAGMAVSAINAEAAARAVLSSVSVTAWINYFFAITAGEKSPLGVNKTMSLNFKTFNDETHTTDPLKIIWGAGLFFNCKLHKATVSYKLFNQLGMPLRANISAQFLELGKGPGTNTGKSPDLTKVHVVKAGDTIYNLAKKEYEDESYYLQIAQANDLKNYRRLVQGQTLILPPIAKVEE